MSNKKLVTLTIRVTPELKEKLNQAATDEGLSFESWSREALTRLATGESAKSFMDKALDRRTIEYKKLTP